MPFICIMEECKVPNVLYQFKEAWLSHMELYHARTHWVCMDLSHDLPLRFEHEQNFEDHIKKDHENNASNEDLSLIANECLQSVRGADLIVTCPFGCENDTEAMKGQEIIEHVMRHLLALSQCSLWGYDPTGPIDYGSAAEITSTLSYNGFESSSSPGKTQLSTYGDDPDQNDSAEIIEETSSPVRVVPPDVDDLPKWSLDCESIQDRKSSSAQDHTLERFGKSYLTREQNISTIQTVDTGTIFDIVSLQSPESIGSTEGSPRDERDSTSRDLASAHESAGIAKQIGESPNQQDDESCALRRPNIIGLQLGFFYTSHYESMKNTNPKRLPKTCYWFLEHARFLEWNSNGRNDVLWLLADPWCGKSVLSRALIDEELVGKENTTLCYFFFRDNRAQDNASDALCALIHQLISSKKGLDHEFTTLIHKGLKNNLQALWRTLIAAATDPTNVEVVCILDGIDECRQADREWLIDQLDRFHAGSSHAPNPGARLKFLVTSRPYHYISSKVSPTIRSTTKELSEMITKEIAIVVKAKVKELCERYRLNDVFRDSLLQQLFKAPNRTYLWVILTLQDLEASIEKGGANKEELRRLHMLSTMVEEAYESILAKCYNTDEAIRTLQIVLAARRPLSVQELDVALGVLPILTDIDFHYASRCETIRSNCGLFVSVVDSHVYLIDQAAQEFLIRRNTDTTVPQRWKHSITLREAHLVLSKKCIDYLLSHDLSKVSSAASSKLLQEPVFLDYSARYWVSHVQKANMNDPYWVSRSAQLCDIGTAGYSFWFKIYIESAPWLRQHAKSTLTALHWAVILGLVNETEYLLKNYSRDHTLQNILLDAVKSSEYGTQLTEVFLRLPEVNIALTDEVVTAAAGNSGSGKGVMALLLHYRGDEVYITSNVVRAAAENEHSGWEIMLLLLGHQSGVIQVTNAMAWQIVSSFYDHVMRLQLGDRGERSFLDWNAADLIRGNLIHKASWDDKEKDVRVLLDQKADCNFVSSTGWTPLAVAAYEGHLGVVKALLENGADPSIADPSSWTPLDLASFWGHLEVVKLLLDNGADITSATDLGMSPLHLASTSGHAQVVKLLLERGANPSIIDNIGETPLLTAAISGQVEVLQLLLDKGADIAFADIWGLSPLHVASAEGQVPAVKLLLERGANPSITDKLGETPLVLATGSGQVEVVQLLLELRVYDDVSSLYTSYGNIANAFAYKGYTDILRLVQDRGEVDLHAVDSHNRTSLHLAVRGGHVETIKYLENQGLKFTPLDAKGDGLVTYAASSGSPDVLRMVLNRGLEVSNRPHHWSALHWACRAGNYEVVAVLLAQGVVCEAVIIPKLEGEWSPLDIAVYHGNGNILGKMSGHNQAALERKGMVTSKKGLYHDGAWCSGCLFVSNRRSTSYHPLIMDRTYMGHVFDVTPALILTTASCACHFWHTCMRVINGNESSWVRRNGVGVSATFTPIPSIEYKPPIYNLFLFPFFLSTCPPHSK